MNRRRPLATLVASLALHGGALVAVLVFASRASELGPLFIDLTEWAEAKPGGGDGVVAASPASMSTARLARAPAQTPGVRPSPVPPGLLRPAPPGSAAAEPVRSSSPPVVAGETPAPPQPAAVEEPGRSDPPVALGHAASSPGAVPPGVSTIGASGSVGGDATVGVRGGVSPAPGGRGGGVRGAPDVSQGFALATPGSGAGAPAAEYGPYLGRLRERIQGSLKYPFAARRRGLAGTVNLEIVITPDGTVGSVAVTTSSSHAILDDAALETVRSLAPEALPSGVPPRILRVRLPVVFALE